MTKRIIAVRFLQSNGLSPKEYSYFTDDDSIEVGDHCVVHVVSNDYGSGPRIVHVTQTEGLSVGVRNKATKWIVQKVDMAGYEERQRKHELVTQIEHELDLMIANQNRYVVFQSYAATNPAIAELLDKLREIDPTLLPPAPAKDSDGPESVLPLQVFEHDHTKD